MVVSSNTSTESECLNHPESEAMRYDEAAVMFRVSMKHLRRLVDAGDFPQPVRLGRAVRFRRAELVAWLAAGAQSPRRSGWSWNPSKGVNS